jgi:hypothetical protein
MRRFLAAVLFASLALLGGAAASAHRSHLPFGNHVWVGIDGWGSVKLRGVFPQSTFRCISLACPAANYSIRSHRVVLTRRAYKGWLFRGWHGACTTMKKTCVINAARAHPDVYVSASFTPGPSLTTPIPMATTSAIGEGFKVRVNSSEPNVSLSPTPPAGLQYFAANVTLSYDGGAAKAPYQTPYQALGQWQAEAGAGTNNNGILHPPYSADATSCPNPGPLPPLDMLDPIQSGQSITGYVCWTIAASDANNLKLFFGTGSYFDYPGTTWFALH